MIPNLNTNKLANGTREQMNDYLSRTMSFSAITVGMDAKTSKGEKLGVRTAVSYLAPFTLSGVNVCPMAELANCHEPCLFTAGRGAMSSVMCSRTMRTLICQQYPEIFLTQLRKELVSHCKACKRDGIVPAYRPNGTSDIRWERWDAWCELMQELVDQYGLRVYDYTKIPNRNVPAWYDLTYSYSGSIGYQPFVRRAIANGERIAVVFRNRETVLAMLDNRETFLGLSIVDGDDTDVRFYDPKNCVVALYAKGQAKHDKSGFVVDRS
jgi:hypothetical protein